MIFVHWCRSLLALGAAGFVISLSGDAAAAGPSLIPSDVTAGLGPAVTAAPLWPELSAGPELSGEKIASPVGTGHEGSATDWSLSPPGDLPPVVRAQSPTVSLIPLSTDHAAIEQTSLLSAATGTSGRLRADYQTDFGGTDRIGVQALTKTWLGIGVDTEANYWQRPVPTLGIEPFWTGDLNVIYSVMPHPRFKLRSGAGAAWRIDDGNPHAGYNLTTGLDVYLLWRFMFTGEIDYGSIDDDKLFHYRAALGLTWQGLEFFSGYDNYRLGSEHLDGWVNGIQFWY